MMKKLLILLATVYLAALYSQSPGLEGLNPITAPSAANISNVVNTPISLATGTPDINIPFFSLPTYSKDISVNAGMMYHPGNVLGSGTDVGLGWNLYGVSNSIYRQMEGNSPDVGTNGGDDMYYYNFLGRSGKFLLRNSQIEKVTLDKLKISFTYTVGNLKFKIIDERGNAFFFDVADRSYHQDTRTEFSNVYYLSKMTDVNNVELLNFEYIKDSYTFSIPHYQFSTLIKSLKLKKVNSPGFGSIELNYHHDISLRNSYNDPYKLLSIELKDVRNITISKYGFEHEMQGFVYPYTAPFMPDPCNHSLQVGKRMLKQILKYNRMNETETTKLYYRTENFPPPYAWSDHYIGCFNNESDNPKYLGQGLLEKIVFPTGGETRYEYEPNQYFKKKDTQAYIDQFAPPYSMRDRDAQYIEYLTTIYFDTHIGNAAFFIVPADPSTPDHYLYFSQTIDTYYPPCEDPSSPHQCDGPTFVNIQYPQGTPTGDGGQKYTAGRKTISITGTGGSGSITVHRIRYKNNPIQNYNTGEGVRIKNITYYENGNIVDALSKKYYYEKFDGTNITSGVIVPNIIDNDPVIYKNVKEVTGNGNGYTKYYFKTLEDYPFNLNSEGMLNYGDLKHYNVIRKGLQDKTEVYNEANAMISSESNDYEFYELPGFITLPSGVNIKNSIIQKHTSNSSIITTSGTITQSSEYTRDIKDHNIINRKTVGADGNLTEQNTTYPWNYRLTDPRLWNASITSVPLMVETKRNGIVVSKSETKFENTANFYPTSQISFLPDNLSQSLKNVSYDVYDDKGNPVQITAFPDAGSGGVSTTIIYGYNKTLPIAKIEGAKLPDIPSNLITAIVNASNEDANATPAQEEAKEQALITALNMFKNDSALQSFMITCYTYNPLVGVTTTIPPNGLMELYKYDSFNRLLKVVDVNGNTVKEHLYNYKN